jgi:hypothetical protein
VRARARLPGRLCAGGLVAGDLDGDGRAEVIALPATLAAGGPRLYRLGADGALADAPIAADLSGRAAATCAWIGDLERDGRAALVLGTAGPLGDDVRVYRWNRAESRLDPAFRQKLGNVTAALGDDLVRSAAPMLAVGVTRGIAVRRSAYGVGDGLHVLAPSSGAGRGRGEGGDEPDAYAVRFRDALAPDADDARRILSLAAGDLTASGAPSLAAVVETRSGARASRAVWIYTGFGLEGGPVRHVLAPPDIAPEWVRMVDLDASGGAELVVGERGVVRIYGLRAGR